jgi:predicted Na+-dependent transporter
MLFPQFSAYQRAIAYIVAFILILNFFEIEFEWKNFLRSELILTVLLSAFIISSLYYLVLSKGLNPDYRIGILLTAIAPSGVMPLVLGRFMQNIDHDLVMSNFLVTTFGSIIYLPFMVKWLVGTTIQIPAEQLLLKTAAMILLPYAVSVIMKDVFSQALTERIKMFAKPVVLILLFINCVLVSSAASQRLIWNENLLRMILLVFSVYLVQGGLAFLIGGFFWNKPIQKTLALISSSRNNQITLGIAAINFAPAAALPCIFGFIFHHVANAIWLYLFRK